MESVLSLELLIYLIGFHFILLKILDGIFDIKKAVIALFLITPFILISFMYSDEIIGDFFAVGCALLGLILPLITTKNIKRARQFYVCLLYFGGTSTVLALCRWIVMIINMDAREEKIISVVLQTVLLTIIVLLSKKTIFYKARQYIELVPMKWKVLLQLSVWFCMASIFLISEYTAISPFSIWLAPMVIFAMIQILSVGIIWPLIILGVSLSTIQKRETARYDEQLQAQIKHYLQFLQANTALRKCIHDFDHVLSGVTGYIKNDDKQGALRIIDECRRTTSNEYTETKTGNVAADALIADKQSHAAESNVKIRFMGVIPSEYVSSLDICVIFGNALDNAIQACTEVPDEKNISVASDMRNGFLFISISNPVKEDVLIRNNIVTTTKTDKENHGIGLVSISRTAQKYGGKMELYCKDRVFTIEIVLDLNPLL
ncbi:MAG: GHKL domain-containing protein [Oscillospiraceae bacterium]|jgi:sensor histidine kinase YesM|nr:GHKL domain-containing protein [Oscillospiraceae bacterium]